MPSTINASNSGSGGLISTGDASGVLALQTAGTTAITVDTSQNVGIGTTSPSSYGAGYKTLTVQGSTQGIIQATDGTTTSELSHTGGIGYVGTRTNSAFGLFTNNTERMRIDTSGNLLVNVSNPANIDGVITSSAPTATRNCLGLRDSGTSYSTGNWYVSFVNSAGASAGAIQHTAATTVAYATSSDKRLKENIVDAPSALDKVLSTKVRSFDWKEDKLHVDYGFIAQELYEVASEAVGKGDDLEVLENPKGTWQVEYGRLTPMLVKAIQEQQALITAQAETINALTARIVALEGK